jgi:two-component system cell cycle response regulator
MLTGFISTFQGSVELIVKITVKTTMSEPWFNAPEVEGSNRVKALVVEDSAVYRKLVGDYLQSWGFEVTMAEDGVEAQEILDRPDAPKLVLLDWVLPDIDGTELCKRIRQTAGVSGTYVYVILLTSKEGRQNMLEAMHAGVDDYLAKPFDEMELKARLMAGKRVLDLQEQLIAARESMRHAATHDSLTGLMNRGEIMSMLERELARGRRDHKPVGVILGDLDHFKQVNDTLGHLFGDETLREIGRRLREQLRVYDSVGRYGGEEFLMILPDCDWEYAVLRANELREIISKTEVDYAGEKKAITMSMGVVVSDSRGKKDVELLLKCADEALYAAKGKGRNRVERSECASGKKASAAQVKS